MSDVVLGLKNTEVDRGKLELGIDEWQVIKGREQNEGENYVKRLEKCKKIK